MMLLPVVLCTPALMDRWYRLIAVERTLWTRNRFMIIAIRGFHHLYVIVFSLLKAPSNKYEVAVMIPLPILKRKPEWRESQSQLIGLKRAYFSNTSLSLTTGVNRCFRSAITTFEVKDHVPTCCNLSTFTGLGWCQILSLTRRLVLAVQSHHKALNRKFWGWNFQIRCAISSSFPPSLLPSFLMKWKAKAPRGKRCQRLRGPNKKGVTRSCNSSLWSIIAGHLHTAQFMEA